jgi:hypothetical protein
MASTIQTGEGGRIITGISETEESSETQKLKVKKNYRKLGFCFNNELIRFNAESTKDKNLLYFKAGITYYFKLTAFNNKFPFMKDQKSVGQDQKSLPSSPVMVTFRLETNE